MLSPCSSSLTPAPSPTCLLSRAVWAALLTDKWPPYGLLPFYLLPFLQLRDSGEQAASYGCAPTTPPPSVMSAKGRVARRTTGLHPIPSRPGASPSAVTYRAKPTRQWDDSRADKPSHSMCTNKCYYASFDSGSDERVKGKKMMFIFLFFHQLLLSGLTSFTLPSN